MAIGAAEHHRRVRVHRVLVRSRVTANAAFRFTVRFGQRLLLGRRRTCCIFSHRRIREARDRRCEQQHECNQRAHQKVSSMLMSPEYWVASTALPYSPRKPWLGNKAAIDALMTMFWVKNGRYCTPIEASTPIRLLFNF